MCFHNETERYGHPNAFMVIQAETQTRIVADALLLVDLLEISFSMSSKSGILHATFAACLDLRVPLVGRFEVGAGRLLKQEPMNLPAP